MAQIYEEDIEAAHWAAEDILGPNGNMEHPLPKGSVVNARVGTKEHGILWYGDLTPIGQRKTTVLANKLGVEVHIYLDS